MGYLPQYAPGDPRPTCASRTAGRSGGAPMEAQGQRLARFVLIYVGTCFIELFDFALISMMNFGTKHSVFC